jgi:hypothetical protein
MGGTGLAMASLTRPLPLSLPDLNMEHERKPSHTAMAERFTAPGRCTRGYSYFTHRTLIFTHLN